ncbi:hypothetical protein GGR57DRAFT_190925 [Xylariaceae sp. FL1272]|nr:hypothetical protein GGR57DRAFT_190925 [Xylariaceae sp. FL1272]
MATTKKRPLDADNVSAPAAKKHRKGFSVGPSNLPDGPWKRKVDRIKKDLIHKAKVKKAYKRIKTAELDAASSRDTKPDPHATTIIAPKTVEDDDDYDLNEATSAERDKTEGLADEEPKIHPQRQALVDDQNDTIPRADDGNTRSPGSNNFNAPRSKSHYHKKKPGYFDKAVSAAERKKAESAKRTAEHERRAAERQRKTQDRERFRRALAKARKPGRDGQRRLGRESGLLLEKAKRLMGESGS